MLFRSRLHPATVDCISIGDRPQSLSLRRTCVLVDEDGDELSYGSANSSSPLAYGVTDSIIIAGTGKYADAVGEVRCHSTDIEASSLRRDNRIRGWSVILYRHASRGGRSLAVSPNPHSAQWRPPEIHNGPHP